MKIFVTGLFTLHWGRLEFGNIGNYYIVEPFFRQLHRVFPGAEIVTTFQMSDEFARRERVRVLPMEWYYAWQDDDVKNALAEFGAAEYYAQTGRLPWGTGYTETVQESDLVVELPGEMWGDYAEPVGKGRFLVALLKNRVVQLLGKPLVLFAGSQGPFSDEDTFGFAREVYNGFSRVVAREPLTIDKTREFGFSLDATKLYACPAFLFEPEAPAAMAGIFRAETIIGSGDERPLVGLSICGFNFAEQPYDKWPRQDDEYTPWAEIAEHIVCHCGARIILISHTNGFDVAPEFCLKPGRDHQVLSQLYRQLMQRGVVTEQDVWCVDRPYLPKHTKAIIGQLDMLVGGRAHATVAAISQSVPTVFIVYNESLKSTKTRGFAMLAGVEDYVAPSEEPDTILRKIDQCWQNRAQLRAQLAERIPAIQAAVVKAFDDLAELV